MRVQDYLEAASWKKYCFFSFTVQLLTQILLDMSNGITVYTVSMEAPLAVFNNPTGHSIILLQEIEHNVDKIAKGTVWQVEKVSSDFENTFFSLYQRLCGCFY